MSTVESIVLTYLLNSLWQVPLVFVAAWIIARLARRIGVGMEHRVWVAALFLEVLLPLCQFHLPELWRQAWERFLSLFSTSNVAGEVKVQIVPLGATADTALRLPEWLHTILVTVYAASVMYFAARLSWALWKTYRVKKAAVPLTLTSEVAHRLELACALFGVPRSSICIAVSPAASTPMVIGIKRRMLLLPPHFMEQVSADDLDAVLAHELAHLQRQDFARNLLYSLLALPVAYHPLLMATRSQIAASRELLCDAMAAEALQGKEKYARSLLQLASMLSQRGMEGEVHAVGIFDANVLERRIMNLKQKSLEIHGLGRLVVGAVCSVLALTTCTSALAFHVEAGVQETAPSAPPTLLHVKFDKLKLLNHPIPGYPPEAKKAKVEGTVVLGVRIGKDGAPKAIHVKSGSPMLQQSAMETVIQWRWQPYLLNGNPIEVDTEVNVVYSLSK